MKTGSMSANLRVVLTAFEMTRGIIATRAIIDGASLSQIGSLLIEEFLLGIIYLLLGYTLFRLFERQANQMGSLEVV